MEGWGGGREESIAFAEAAVSFKKPVIDIFPQKTFCHAHQCVCKEINLEKESNQQSSCDRFSDGVLINHTDNEVANCCLIAKLERQLPQ